MLQSMRDVTIPMHQAAKCLDGSYYAYGFRHGHGTGRDKWLIHLQVPIQDLGGLGFRTELQK